MKKPFSSDARRNEKTKSKKRLKRGINNSILVLNQKSNGLYRLDFQYKPFSFLVFACFDSPFLYKSRHTSALLHIDFKNSVKYNDFDVIIAFRKTNLKEILIFFSINSATKSEKLSTYMTGGIKERRKFINNAN